jgi:flagellar operon protein
LALLKDAVNRAEAKGAKESLILMDRLALVVSVKNRTVITAVDDQNLKDNIFTNIDSAVIVKQ